MQGVGSWVGGYVEMWKRHNSLSVSAFIEHGNVGSFT